MSAARRALSRWAWAPVIITGAWGCDNVEWGGFDVRLEPPPPPAGEALEDTLPAVEDPAALPTGPVLFVGERDSAGVALVPVAEILGDSLASLPTESAAPGFRARFARANMQPGTEFVLFAAGTRVGTFTTRSLDTDADFCSPLPSARGVVELVPEASGVTRFLALPREGTGTWEHGTWAPVEHDRDQRVAMLDLAAAAIPQVGAPWPTSILEARGDMQAFRPGGGEALLAATFLFRDQLLVQPATPTSWSLFILAAPAAGGWEAAEIWYRPAGTEGKGAPRLWDFLDWDQDGEVEVLLEVLGERSRWHAALDRRDGDWVRSWETPCGAAVPPVAAGG